MVENVEKIRIGISSCLVGQNVRFDGGNKRDRYITDTLSNYFHWVPVCPEVELGLGTPRPTLRFQKIDKDVRLIQPATGKDLTDEMAEFAEKRVKKLKGETIYGYVLKSRSPSCGKGGIKIYKGHAIRPATNGIGLYAKRLIGDWPNLPVEDEGRLCDPVLRENWINQVFAYYSFQSSLFPRPTVGKLVKFHSSYKFTILSHCNTTYRQLGPLVAGAKKHPIKSVVEEYENLFMAALKKRATAAKHVNVMEHMIGFFKKELDSNTRKEILVSVEDFRKGIVPVIVPITLIKHYARVLKIDYLMDQSYLSPHPKELALRSSI